jgi:hypothetical protein
VAAISVSGRTGRLDPRSIGPAVLTVALAIGRALPSLDDGRRLQT